MTGVLDGIRVFDLTLAGVGPWASKQMGLLGADVIHVEGPNPEMSHFIPPQINGEGVLYIAANYNKRNMILDLKDDQDRQTAYRLIETCDVFVQNMRPGAVEKLGVGYEDVRRIRPDIVYVSSSAWGRVGPMATEAGVDPLLQSFCGWASVNGEPGGSGEMFRHFAHLDLTTSSQIVEAVLAAILHRERSGDGQHIEMEMLRSALSLQTSRLAEYFASGEPPSPMGSAVTTTVPHEAFECLDGRWLAVGVVRDDQWSGFCRALGLDELGADGRFVSNVGRVAHRDELIGAIEARLRTKPLTWWALCLEKEKVPHARFEDFDSLRHHPQVTANDYITEIDTPHFGRIAVEGPPWKFSDTLTTPVVAGGRAGEHNAEILAELDTGDPTGGFRRRIGESAGAERPVIAASAGPLDGHVVIDLSDGMAGPFAASRLGDLGANVIKVEPLHGDSGRGIGPPFVDGESAVFAALNRNKRSIAVDLETVDGHQIVRDLLAGADAVIEDLGPGRAVSYGLGYDDLADSLPELVYVSISAWGEQGPMADLPGAELPVQAMAEFTSSLGVIGEPPRRLGTDVANLNTGIFASQAVLAGLVARTRSGRGQKVEVSMLGSLLHLRGIIWTARSNPDDWFGFHLDSYTNPPETGYATADGQVYFGLRRGTSEDFDQLMITLGLIDHIADTEFAGYGREAAPLGRYGPQSRHLWEQGFATLTSEEVIALLHENNGDAVTFNDFAGVTSHPQTAAIGALAELDRPDGGTTRVVAPSWTFDRTPAVLRRRAPRLGEHTDEILAEFGL